ncbi:MAG: right-handed parallel beta-helix repeat-containing protein [Candidatus Thermoplasmatota archaeon]|nr:right-handed parallel beta-helix repeat-containing protein [Candidatus Thermoplasmatota archaeon]
MQIANAGKSVGLVGLLLTSLMIGLITVPTASAVNETASGTILTTETWSGTHTLTDNIRIAEGAKLIINAGTTINIPAGKVILVDGALCAGSASCGASQASASSPIRLNWANPADTTVTGICSDPQNNLLNNPDAACGSGVVIRNTINQASTGLSYVTFDNAYGFPVYVASQQSYKYAALVFDGSSTNADNLVFNNVNTTNLLAIDFASPTIRDSTFTLGVDGLGYNGPGVESFNAGAGILSRFTITNSEFTGDPSASCNDGISLIYAENSFVDFDTLDVKENSQGVFLRGSSGSFGNSTFDVGCNGIDTNSYKTTGDITHTLHLDNNVITTGEGAGITAYDGAIVSATGNTISGASSGSGFGVRDSTVSAHRNTIGPITGYNGFWVYGQSEVEIENNTIQDTAKEPIQIGEYHYRDSNSNYPGPSPNRAYIANNIISNNSGTCNSFFMYGGDFNCPAIHIFSSSATIVDNTITNNAGDGLRIKGSIVNVQRNSIEAGQIAANISHYDNKNGQKYGSLGYFSGNTWTNATQVYNISESRVTVQSEYIPDATGGYLFPVMLRWLSTECPYVQSSCLLLADTAAAPPRDMPLAIELVNNSTVFSFADLQNFDEAKIHVQNQNSAWGSQVRQGELVRYQVKAKNSNVAGATVIIKDATGLPLYELTTDSLGFTQQVSLPSNFLLDRNWNHFVGENNVIIPGSDDGTGSPITLDEDTCSDGYDNDGDTYVDEDDPDCANGRELPFYIVEAYKFGKGKKDFDFVLSGSIDDIISLDNERPSVTVEQYDGDSFAINAVITGTAWDGQSGPYPLDIIAYDRQFGLIERVEIQPPGSTDWYYAVDTSGANGELTKENHPFKTWSFDWDLSAHPDGESDVTFRIRSYDGLDYSPIEVRKFKLNLVPPTLYLNEPLDGSTHSNGKILFTGTASDPYAGTWGSDIQDIWFDVSGPNGYASHFAIDGSVAWAYEWNFEELETGEYTFEVWASDSDFCDDVQGTCVVSTRTVMVLNDNIIPIVDLLEPDGTQPVQAEETTTLLGFASDGADGTITRVEIEILDLASGLILSDGPGPVTTFQKSGPGYSWSAVWDTSKLIHERQYEIRVKAYDGEDYSIEDVVRITISKPTNANNIPPQFNSTAWPNQVTIFCVVGSTSENQCGGGAAIDLKQYFSDPDSSFNQLSIDFLDDQTDPNDDSHPYFITIDSEGFARYDPAISQSNEDIATWTIDNVRFIVRDTSDEFALSRDITFFVQAIEFGVERDNPTGTVTATSTANFSGTGLPGARIEARSADSETLIKTVVVGETGTWKMALTLQDMNDASNDLKFLMDGQTFGGSSEPETFSVVVGEADGGSNLFLIIGIVIAALVLLGGVGYFFIEFEDIEEEGFAASEETQEKEDPYAWGRKETPQIPEQQPAAVPIQPAQAQSSAQHPGWLWDQETNQWVPDPNYQPPSQ